MFQIKRPPTKAFEIPLKEKHERKSITFPSGWRKIIMAAHEDSFRPLMFESASWLNLIYALCVNKRVIHSRVKTSRKQH